MFVFRYIIEQYVYIFTAKLVVRLQFGKCLHFCIKYKCESLFLHICLLNYVKDLNEKTNSDCVGFICQSLFCYGIVHLCLPQLVFLQFVCLACLISYILHLCYSKDNWDDEDEDEEKKAEVKITGNDKSIIQCSVLILN